MISEASARTIKLGDENRDGVMTVTVTAGEVCVSEEVNPWNPASLLAVALPFDGVRGASAASVIQAVGVELSRAGLSGAAMLNDVRALLHRYVVLPSEPYYDVVALWIAHTHVVAAFDTTPRLIFKSAEKESGKTRCLEVLELLVSEPLSVMNATVAAIFRLLKDTQVTVLYDEVDAIFGPKAANHEELRGLLNAGYRKGATVARVVGEGKGMRSERFPVYAATALAAIGDLPDTIESRAIPVPMRRRAPGEHVDSFRLRAARAETEKLRMRLAAWGAANSEALKSVEPVLPDGITDRAADIWEPLLAIADSAGSDWPRRAADAAVAVVRGRVAQDASTGVRLLADVKAVMGSEERISSAQLCERLNSLEESPWGGWNAGKGIGQRDLARRLKPYGVESKNVRQTDGSVPKGYTHEDLADPFARYLRVPFPGSATGATSATPIRTPVAAVAHVADTRPQGEATESAAADLLAAVLTVFPGSTVTTSTRRWEDVPDDRPHRGGELPAVRDLLQAQGRDQQRRQRDEALRLGVGTTGRWS